MPEKRLTSSEIIRRAQTPVFDVFRSEKGDVVVQVKGVRAPFEIQISKRTLMDDAPFGRPTPESIMRTARELAQYECVRRGLI